MIRPAVRAFPRDHAQLVSRIGVAQGRPKDLLYSRPHCRRELLGNGNDEARANFRLSFAKMVREAVEDARVAADYLRIAFLDFPRDFVDRGRAAHAPPCPHANEPLHPLAYSAADRSG